MTEHYLKSEKLNEMIELASFCFFLFFCCFLLFFCFFLEKPLYEGCLLRIQQQVDENMSTVGIHRNVDSLLKSAYTGYSNYVVNQKLDHLDDFCFREHFGGSSFF